MRKPYRLNHPDNEQRRVSAAAVGYHRENGRITGLVMHIVDDPPRLLRKLTYNDLTRLEAEAIEEQPQEATR